MPVRKTAPKPTHRTLVKETLVVADTAKLAQLFEALWGGPDSNKPGIAHLVERNTESIAQLTESVKATNSNSKEVSAQIAQIGVLQGMHGMRISRIERAAQWIIGSFALYGASQLFPHVSDVLKLLH